MNTNRVYSKPEHHPWRRAFVICGMLTGWIILAFGCSTFTNTFREGVASEGIINYFMLIATGVGLIIGGFWVFAQTKSFKFVNDAPLKVKVVMTIVSICGIGLIIIALMIGAAGKES